MNRRAVTAILGGTIFSLGMTAAAINPYRGVVAVDGLHMSNALYALVTGVSAVETAVVSLLLGHFADRVPDRRFGVLVCAAFSALGYALVFFAPSQLSYVIAFCAILPLGGALFSQTFSFSRAYYDRVDAAHAEFMMSMIRTLFSLAWVLSPAVVGLVAVRFSVFGVFGAAALAQLACLFVFSLLFVIPGTKIGTGTARPSQPSGKRAVPVGRIIGVAGVTLLQTAILLHLMGIPLVLTNNFHGNLADVSLNAAIAAALEIPFMVGWGYAAIRISKEIVMIASALVYALYLAAVCLFAHSVQDVLWLQAVNAIGTGALVSIPISYMQETIKGRVGLSTALLDLVSVLAWILASGVFALVSTQQDYLPVLMGAAVVSTLGAIAIGVSKMVTPAPQPQTPPADLADAALAPMAEQGEALGGLATGE